MSKTMQEIVAGTQWTALAEPDGVYLFADDFCEHDAALQLTGDFATPADFLAYAQALADRLNGIIRELDRLHEAGEVE